MTVLEQRATAQPRSEFVQRLFAGEATEVPLPPEPPDLAGYLELAVRGGYRLVKTPKRYVMDPGPAAVLLGIDAAAVMSHGDALARLLDTFVLAQLRPMLALDTPPARAYHLRQHDGRREVDVVLEAADGRGVGLEIKAAAAPSRHDARHLAWQRDQLGDRSVAGAVLNTGYAAWRSKFYL